MRSEEQYGDTIDIKNERLLRIDKVAIGHRAFFRDHFAADLEKRLIGAERKEYHSKQQYKNR